jgi:cysteine synthase
MSTATIETAVKMLATLPKPIQERAVEHLREYIEDLKDEIVWDNQFSKSSNKLAEMARKAKQEIADGKTLPMDFEGK